MKRTIAITVLGCLIFGCREDYSLDIPQEEIGLNLFAELAPGNPVSVSIFSSQVFGSSGELVSPEDAIIKFSGTDLDVPGTDFIFIPGQSNYQMQNLGFTPGERNTYELLAYLPGSDSDTLRARTYIPPASTFGLIEVLSNKRLGIGENTFNHKITLRIDIPEPQERPAYYQIIPRRVLSSFREDQFGNIIITDTPDREVMDIESILNNQNAISELTHKNGIFVDYSRINDGFVDLELTSRSDLSSFTDAFTSIQVELRTLSSELYSYHQFTHRRLISSETDFSYPVGSYSNVENGKGVFGAYSMSFSTIFLK